MSISPNIPLSTQLELDSPTDSRTDSIFDTPAYKESSFKTSEVEQNAKNSLDFLIASLIQIYICAWRQPMLFLPQTDPLSQVCKPTCRHS